MSIDKYVHEFRWLLVELKESLSEEDIDQLRADVSALPEGGWGNFVRNNQEVIAAFLKSTPSRRAKLKKFQEPSLKKRLILAAIQRMKAACILSDKLLEDDFVGMSYREASSVVADHYYDLFYSYPGRYWPFDETPPKGFRIDEGDLYY